MPSNPDFNRITGHALMNEGAPHNAEGSRMGSLWRIGGQGRGKCECGALSSVLQSGNLRKQWHREHKGEIRAEVQ